MISSSLVSQFGSGINSFQKYHESRFILSEMNIFRCDLLGDEVPDPSRREARAFSGLFERGSPANARSSEVPRESAETTESRNENRVVGHRRLLR